MMATPIKSKFDHLTLTKETVGEFLWGTCAGDCFRKIFVFIGQLSPKGAGRGREHVGLIMITINSVYCPNQGYMQFKAYFIYV